MCICAHVEFHVFSRVKLPVEALEIVQVVGEPHRDRHFHLLGPVYCLGQLFRFGGLFLGFLLGRGRARGRVGSTCCLVPLGGEKRRCCAF